MPINKSPAMRGHSGRSLSVQLGGIEQLQHSPAAAFWEDAREMERRSVASAREALIMRGSERFQALALASTYAFAARDLALTGRGAR